MSLPLSMQPYRVAQHANPSQGSDSIKPASPLEVRRGSLLAGAASLIDEASRLVTLIQSARGPVVFRTQVRGGTQSQSVEAVRTEALRKLDLALGMVVKAKAHSPPHGNDGRTAEITAAFGTCRQLRKSLLAKLENR